MLGDRKVISLSPELGIHDRKSDHFTIRNKKVLSNVLKTNAKWVEFVLSKLSVLAKGKIPV